ncbi:MAG: DMT family transporter [Hylemonella sp.]|nr:DMT family transporter [Hylemonella sp.]
MDLTRHRAGRLAPTVQGLLWSIAAGLCFVLLNTMTRYLTTQIPPLQSQFLRYLCGVIVLLPLVLRTGMAAWMPQNIRGQFVRGFVHAAGLGIWFTAIPHISLSETTAMGFTTPIFIMLGAWLFLREPMHWERWLAAGIGFAGVLIVVGPNLSGQAGWWNLVMLSSAPMFAASFLISKALTRYESAGVIVLWQSITVTILSLPLALLNWQPVSAVQWAGYMLCGVLGSGAHYLLMRSYAVADISATQSVKFLDLVWAALMGWLVFADVPTSHSLIGGAIIAGSTLWIARREARRGT